MPSSRIAELLREAEQRRVSVSRALTPTGRANLGQFFTPTSVANILADLVRLRPHLRVLDPGAGVGSLTASLVARVLEESDTATVHVATFEVDPGLEAPLARTLNDWQRVAGGRFTFEQYSEDFISWAVRQSEPGLFGAMDAGQFDLVLMNPPYRKINAQSAARRMLEHAGFPTTNLYTAFLGMGQRLLADEGQLVAITPRSFFNGTYFREFRRSFLAELGFEAIHVFESRKKAFAGDAVLQENVVFAATKGASPANVVVTTSNGVDDELHGARQVPTGEVVRPDDPDYFIHVTTDEGQAEVARRMLALPGTLAGLGLTVSTGRVVDFRARQWLRVEAGEGTAPLIYQSHIRGGGVRWPLAEFRKPQHMEVTPDDFNQFVPTGYYVLTKRFTAKEERRRITAGFFEPEEAPGYDFVGFENHTNVFHAGGHGIEAVDVARGLATFLNSTVVDLYFRQFSGHTQVNSGDLRSLRYPNTEQLRALGAATGVGDHEQEKIDALVEEHIPALAGDGRNPLSVQRRIKEAIAALRALDMPREQLNERSALTLLALLGLKPDDPWSAATAPLRGITPMMDFFAEHYGKTYKPNTRETVRRQTVHQFVDSGLVLYNPDRPERPVNSPKAVYQVEQSALLLLQQFGESGWNHALMQYRGKVQSLRERHAAAREMARIPVMLPDGQEVTLSPGGQNVLIKEIIDGFCARFVPGGHVLYLGDADEKWAVKEEAAFADLGLIFDKHGKMPDVVVYDPERNWLVLIEAVTSHGPVSPKRHEELKRLVAGSRAGLVFVTAFLTRRAFAEYLHDISWETEVWCADSPTHLVHFNGVRFLGPYDS